jgi:hypothetical protein
MMRPTARSHRTACARAIGPETSRVLAYALAGVAEELARLIRRHMTRRRKALTRRGESRLSKRDVLQLLCQAFSQAMLNARGVSARAAKQRHALAFVLAAADLPSALRTARVPGKIRRRQRSRRR